MNTENPKISRLLAKLIQIVEWEDRQKFIKDAKESKDLHTFLKVYRTYRKTK